MIPAELERLILKSISDGKIPFFVTATAGTTVFGSFDPINPIADICEKHHLWLHIDVIQFELVILIQNSTESIVLGRLGWRSLNVRKVPLQI